MLVLLYYAWKNVYVYGNGLIMKENKVFFDRVYW